MKAETVFIICVTIVLLSIVTCCGFYVINDRELMAKNIDSAITKGIDPLSVRCAYVSSTDSICMAFAISGQAHVVPNQNVIKK